MQKDGKIELISNEIYQIFLIFLKANCLHTDAQYLYHLLSILTKSFKTLWGFVVVLNMFTQNHMVKLRKSWGKDPEQYLEAVHFGTVTIHFISV